MHYSIWVICGCLALLLSPAVAHPADEAFLRDLRNVDPDSFPTWPTGDMSNYCFFADPTVTCVSNRIQTVSLPLSFKGELPASIGNVTTLVDLLAFSNNLTGQLPDVFGSLNSLVKVDFSYNSLTGTIPRSLLRLPSLVYLYLSHNFIEAIHPDIYLPNLEVLHLQGNLLSTVPIGLRNSTKLNSLLFFHNRIRCWPDGLVGALEALPKPIECRLHFNPHINDDGAGICGIPVVFPNPSCFVFPASVGGSSLPTPIHVLNGDKLQVRFSKNRADVFSRLNNSQVFEQNPLVVVISGIFERNGTNDYGSLLDYYYLKFHNLTIQGKTAIVFFTIAEKPNALARIVVTLDPPGLPDNPGMKWSFGIEDYDFTNGPGDADGLGWALSGGALLSANTTGLSLTGATYAPEEDLKCIYTNSLIFFSVECNYGFSTGVSIVDDNSRMGVITTLKTALVEWNSFYPSTGEIDGVATDFRPYAPIYIEPWGWTEYKNRRPEFVPMQVKDMVAAFIGLSLTNPRFVNSAFYDPTISFTQLFALDAPPTDGPIAPGDNTNIAAAVAIPVVFGLLAIAGVIMLVWHFNKKRKEARETKKLHSKMESALKKEGAAEEKKLQKKRSSKKEWQTGDFRKSTMLNTTPREGGEV